MDEDAFALPTLDAQEIQAAIDRTAGTGRAAVIPLGVYIASSPVCLRSDVTLIFEEGTVLRRNFSGDATLTQAGDTKIANVKVSGGRVDNPQSYPGSNISVYGDNIEIIGMELLDFYPPGLGILIIGDNNRLSDLRVVTSCVVAGAGGIRMAGGSNFLCSDCYVESGDDALQFVPLSPNVGSPVEDVSIAESQYVNCVGISAVARACVVFLENRSSSDVMTASVTDCAFIGIRGQGGTIGALCATKGLGGQPATGTIFGIQFIGVGLSLPAAATGSVFQVQRDIDSKDGSNDGGPIQQIDFIGCTALRGPAEPGLTLENAAHVRWTGGSIAVEETATLAVSILSSTDCTLSDTTVVCSGNTGATGISVSKGSGSSDRIRITGLSVVDIAEAGTGIYLDHVNACAVTGCTFLRGKTVTDSTGISTAGATNCLFAGNDMLNVDVPYVLDGSSGSIESTLGVSTSAAGTVPLVAGTSDVAFAFPFLNSIYAVQLTGDTTGETFAFSKRTTTGFTITSSNPQSTAEVSWTALLTQFKS